MGAILLVRVPATSIISACLGEARITIPKRSISYRLIAACIISTAQQAKPKVSGHSDPARAQDITEINLVEIHSSFIKEFSRWQYRELKRLGEEIFLRTLCNLQV